MMEFQTMIMEIRSLRNINEELRAQLVNTRSEYEASIANLKYCHESKLEHINKEMSHQINKNNLLKQKIHKIKEFMHALSQLVKEVRLPNEGEGYSSDNKTLSINHNYQHGNVFSTAGQKLIKNDSDSEVNKLPTLESLCE